MIDALVTSKIQERSDVAALREQWENDYKKLFPAGGTEDLAALSSRLSAAVATFVPGAAVTLAWSEEHPEVPIPDVWSEVSEDGVPTDIDHQGHGMQRAMIIALLQAHDDHIRSLQGSESADSATHILLLIEEPELYQHPPRARHFRRLLKKLASDSSARARFRIVSSTHSPNFVSLDDLDSVRVVSKKYSGPGNVPVRDISALSLPEIREKYALATGNTSLTETDIRKNLHVLNAPLREAFFASAIVLTEGVSDIGVLEAVSDHMGVDVEAKGIVLASMGGKGLIPLAIVILKSMGIRNYIIFDSDSAAQLADNQLILRLVGAPPADIPQAGELKTTIRDSYAVLHTEMEDVLKRDFGEANYNQCVAETAALFGKKPDQVMKNPAAARYVIDLLHARGLTSPTLESIISKISAL